MQNKLILYIKHTLADLSSYQLWMSAFFFNEALRNAVYFFHEIAKIFVHNYLFKKFPEFYKAPFSQTNDNSENLVATSHEISLYDFYGIF